MAPARFWKLKSGPSGVVYSHQVGRGAGWSVAPAAAVAGEAHQNQLWAQESFASGPDYPALPAPRSEHQYLNTQPITASIPEYLT